MIKDKPGLTRLTWNTDWAFLEKKQPPAHQTKQKINFQRHLSPISDLTNPPPSLFIILQYFT